MSEWWKTRIASFVDRTRNDRGATLVEYAVIVSLVLMATFSGFDWFNDRLEEQFDQISSSLSDDDAVTADEESDPGDDGGGGDEGGPTPTTTTVPPSTTTTTTPPVPDEASEDVAVVSSDSVLEWWNNSYYGDYGEWEAQVMFENDWDEAQILTLEVTVHEHDGTTSTSTMTFYVPANSTGRWTLGDNYMRERYYGITGVTHVTVTVTEIATTDGAGDPVTYPTSGPSVTVWHPDV